MNELQVVEFEALRVECLRTPHYELSILAADYLFIGHGISFTGPRPRILVRLPDRPREHGYCLVCRKVMDEHGCTYGGLVSCLQLEGDSFMAVEIFCRGPRWKA